MLLSLGHVTLRSADFDRTERFYCGLLGLCIGPRPAIALPGR
jgi:extradiol dioxygenase family protein